MKLFTAWLKFGAWVEETERRDPWLPLAASLFWLCILVSACAVHKSTPKPPTPPTPTPAPTPTPKACPIIEDDDAAVVDQGQQYGALYLAAVKALQKRHADWFAFDEFGHWQAKAAGDQKHYPTPPAVEAFRVEFYKALGAEFVLAPGGAGLCFQQISDELHVFDPSATPVVSERYKPMEWGGGREMQKPYMGRTLAVIH